MTQQFSFDTQQPTPKKDSANTLTERLTHHIAHWWQTVDKTALFIAVGLVIFGSIMAWSASPSVAKRNDLGLFYFANKQFMFAIPMMVGMAIVSSLSIDNARRLAIIGFVCTIAVLVLLPFVGLEKKGATRWISVLGILTIQPTEILKPTFVVVSAWFLSAWRLGDDIPGHWIATGLFVMSAGLVIIQPDLGQTLLLTSAFLMQFFVLGIPYVWVLAGFVLGVSIIGFAFFTFAHVRDRFDQFLNPDPYSQIAKSLSAFSNGGFFGTGMGSGQVKIHIPDAHTDFVFAVIGEELGLFGATALMGIFLYMCSRCIARLRNIRNLFVILSAGALVWLLVAQFFVNIASTMGLIPTKGMTLPFISSGLSSLAGTCFAMGLILAFTRKPR